MLSKTKKYLFIKGWLADANRHLMNRCLCFPGRWEAGMYLQALAQRTSVKDLKTDLFRISASIIMGGSGKELWETYYLKYSDLYFTCSRTDAIWFLEQVALNSHNGLDEMTRYRINGIIAALSLELLQIDAWDKPLDILQRTTTCRSLPDILRRARELCPLYDSGATSEPVIIGQKFLLGYREPLRMLLDFVPIIPVICEGIFRKM